MNNVRVGVLLVIFTIAVAGCSSSSAGIEATAESDAAASGTEAEPAAVEPTPEPTATPRPTPVPEPTEPPADPEPTAAARADAATDVDSDADGDAESEAAFVQCLARSAAGDVDLLKALTQVSTDTYDQIDDAQLDRLATEAVECRLVEESLGTDDDATMALAAPCLNERLTSESGGQLFVALAAVGQDQSVQEPLRPTFVDAMDDCLGASVMADAIVTEAELDPAMEGVFDRDCLVTEFEESGSVRAIWEQVAIDPTQIDTFDAGAEVAVAATVRCASMGAIVAAAAAEDGIDLSAESIACIDEKAAAINMTDVAAEDDFGVAMLACLNEDELGALLAS